MKISIQKLRYSHDRSVESFCYTAIVCIDGIPSLKARNTGEGNETRLTELVAGAHARLSAYVDTLPPYEDKFVVGLTCRYTPGFLVDLQVARELGLRAMRKELKRKYLFAVTEDTTLYPEGLYVHGTKPSKGYNNLCGVHRRLQKELGDKFLILNDMSEKDAFELYEKYEGDEQRTFGG